MKKNIAVVGCGYWGKNLVRNFAELGSLAAICDPDDELAKKYSKKFSTKNMSFKELCKDKSIQGIVLAVPASLHSSMAIDAMKNHKHVFVEKPLAMNQSEARKMIDASRENNVKLMVGHLLQYHPVFKKIKEIVNLNIIGKLNYIYSNRLSLGKLRTVEDVIWSFAPHDISMILSLAKDNPVYVQARTANTIQTNIADHSIISMKFQSGLKAHIFSSWLHPYKEQKLVVTGEFGILEFNDTKDWNEKLSILFYEKETIKGNLSLKLLEQKFIETEETEPLKNECIHFSEVVNNGISPDTDGTEGLNVLKVLTMATKSASEGF